jgi:hypothetical protein
MIELRRYDLHVDAEKAASFLEDHGVHAYVMSSGQGDGDRLMNRERAAVLMVPPARKVKAEILLKQFESAPSSPSP